MTENNGLLKGIRVIDLSRVLAGPYCTMMLGDMGAEIIKVEAPGRGDDTRHWGPPFAEGGESAYFLSTNRNKRSVTLNLKSPNGMEVLKDLIRTGDVLIDNFKKGTLEKFGLDYEALQELRPGLIYCTITGFGYSGPYSDRPGYDFIIQAMGGLMSLNGPKNGEPFRVGIAIADILTGLYAGNAILASLYAREQTGEGQRIDMALLDSQVAALSHVASNFLITGERPKRYGNEHPTISPYQVFKGKDKYFAIGTGNDLQWVKFCNAIGREEWIEDERFATNPRSVEHRDELTPILQEIFETRTATEWIELGDQIGLPAAEINSVDEVFADPQVVSRENVIEVDHPTAGKIKIATSPMKIPTNPTSVRFPPPLLGEHNEEILREVLGYSESKIEELKNDGLV
jgi:formyl-CoA transferase